MKHELTPLARAMRNQPTDAERRLWHILRARPGGFKFRRQFPIGRYIVDFACYQVRMVVEVDGKFHVDQEADVERDAWISAQGWHIARYWNDDVRTNAEGVLADIQQRLAALR